VEIRRPRPGVVEMTLHAYQLATLVAAARWVVEGAQGDLTSDAMDQLRKVLASYDRACGA
jgi:hypothetical protein